MQRFAPNRSGAETRPRRRASSVPSSARFLHQERTMASLIISIHCNSFHLLPGSEMKSRLSLSPRWGVSYGEPQLGSIILWL